MRLLKFFVPLSVLMVSACTHHPPVASAPTPPVPVDTRPVAQPAPVQQRAESVPAPTRASSEAPPRSTTMSDRERTILNEYLAKLEDALFDYDKSTIRSDATSALRDDVNVIRGMLADYPAQKLTIEGHTDERGSDEYNLALGDRRAQAAEEFLSTMGISPTQLTVISYGKQRPTCTEASEGCWQRNRRAHITAAP
jgi:peptidoglycan-associated lipoprotein